MVWWQAEQPQEEAALLLGEKYRPLIIKEYPFWTLVLHEKQSPYVGRCYAWWKDQKPGDGERLQAGLIPKTARGWLFDQIFWEVIRACRALGYSTQEYGSKFLLNMCCLANMPAHNHHMHWHFIPRSAHPIIIEQIDLRVDDREWGSNYARPSLGEHELESTRLEFIRQLMVNAI